MAKVILSGRANDDIDRLFDFLTAKDLQWAAEAIEVIRSGINILGTHPLIGRPSELGLRELVISKGRSGYLALYDYDEECDKVTVLALRHQRETGYS
jgi:plasmid stabilization system protein ParE